MNNLDGNFDYIIVGAGTAGCIMANRLSEDPKVRVLLIEAGGEDDWIWYRIPVGYLYAIGNPRSDWMFNTVEDPGLNGRSLAYPRGKVIGGSSSINAMIAMRGQVEDYNSWRDTGLTGWGWDDVFPLFKKMEDHFMGSTSMHGKGGGWRVEQPRVSWEVLDVVADAAEQIGIPKTDDFNTGDNEGVGYFHVNQKKGTRWSAARGFLKPVLSRENLKLITGANADKVVFEGKKATGVIYEADGKFFHAKTQGEVVLTSGSVGSVQILQRSGIGPSQWIKDCGIEVRHDLQGVGRNLQDHLQQRAIYKVKNVRTLNDTYNNLFKRVAMAVEYALFKRGPLTMAPSQLGIFARSSIEHSRANIEFHVQPLSLDKFGDPFHKFPGLTMSSCNLRPTSRGTIKILDSDIKSKPEIAPNYISTEEDKIVASDAIRLTRKLMAQPALSRFQPEEYLPGPSVGDDQASLVKAAGDIGTTIFHPVGTAKMGISSDPMAVVDGRLRVFGMQNLRVVDASVMPTITSGNTNTPTSMIAMKGAEMILEDYQSR